LGGLLPCDHQNVHRQAEVLADEVSVMASLDMNHTQQMAPMASA
jgi:hypothetical protein